LKKWRTNRRESHEERLSSDLDTINEHLQSCQNRMLWIKSTAAVDITSSMEAANQAFWGIFQHRNKEKDAEYLSQLHVSVKSRLGFYKSRWLGAKVYGENAMQRLENQGSAVSFDQNQRINLLTNLKLYNLMAQNESRLNFRMAKEQKKLAQIAKRNSDAVRGITLVGLIFLPGTYIAVSSHCLCDWVPSRGRK
jgi:hypothetical protein